MKRLALLLLVLTGCSLSHTVNDAAFKHMPLDRKLRLFDAENDVSIAIDEREQMRDRIRDLKAEIGIAKAERRAARDDAAHDASPEGRKEGALADTMWQRRVDYLEGSIDYLHDRMDAQDSVILVARAKFELAKALIVKRNKLRGAGSINIRDFEQQVADCEQKMHMALAEVERKRAPLERIRTDWLRLRDELASDNLRSLATPGDDELPVWESW